MIKFVVNKKEKGQTLEKYIKKALSMAPLSYIYKLFRKKDIRVNSHWQKEKYVLKENDEVTIYITESQLEDFKNKVEYTPNDAIKDWIIYEDKNVLLINKPRGVLVQKDDHTQTKALDQMVIEYLVYKNEYNYKNDVAFKPGPAHRIDRNTSGIVIFGKNHDTLAYLFSLFKDHSLVEKHYLTLVNGAVEQDGEVNAPLRKNFDLKKVVVAKLKDGAKEAKTLYKVKERFKDTTLLDITLITGRTHQIRAHMSYIRHHVIGDSKYGDFTANKVFEKEFNFKNQFLHASKISFKTLAKPLDYLSNKSFEAKLNDEYEVILTELRKQL